VPKEKSQRVMFRETGQRDRHCNKRQIVWSISVSGRKIGTLDSRLVYENRWMKVREDRTVLPDGSNGIYGYVEKPDFVVIAPIDEGRVHLVQQYRYPIGSRQWEFPQGSWEDNASANPADVAKGELEEETGLRTKNIREVSCLYPLYGTTNQSYRIFLATELSAGQTRREKTEQDLIAQEFSLSEFERMIRDGVIRDAATVASFGLLRLKGLI
jgi:8-oxo-dGTP pyrophosphatase MutT (NUDIX family)